MPKLNQEHIALMARNGKLPKLQAITMILSAGDVLTNSRDREKQAAAAEKFVDIVNKVGLGPDNNFDLPAADPIEYGGRIRPDVNHFLGE